MGSEYDISLERAQINWKPEEGLNLPPVEVVGSNVDDDLRYSNSWGASNIEFVEASKQEKLEMLFAQFVFITAVDGMPADTALKAFRQIPEFRASLAKIGWQGD